MTLFPAESYDPAEGVRPASKSSSSFDILSTAPSPKSKASPYNYRCWLCHTKLLRHQTKFKFKAVENQTKFKFKAVENQQIRGNQKKSSIPDLRS